MKLFNQSIKKFQAGAALIEFAIVVPLLLLLVVGISEFGYAFYHLNILNKSVQDGARYFSDSGHATNDKVGQSIVVTSANPYYPKTQNLVIYGNTAVPSPCTSSTSPPCPLMPTVGNYTVNVTSPDANHIRVTATYQHDFMLGNVLNNFLGIPDPFQLTASSVLRVE